MPSTDDALFWDLAAPLLASGVVDQGTVMGHPCLRIRGKFLAMPFHAGPGLVLKLPPNRVAALVTNGEGQPFAPAGRVFREWLHIPAGDARLWAGLLAEVSPLSPENLDDHRRRPSTP